jgi:iron complex transport system substrate-binding protein
MENGIKLKKSALRLITSFLVSMCVFSFLGIASAASPRIVSLSPGITEIFYSLGAEDLLVGVSRQCDYPIAAKLKPRFGNFNLPDMNKLAAGGPDLVLFSEQVRPEAIEALAAQGIKSMTLAAHSVEDVFSAIAKVGEISDRTEQATELVRTLRGQVARVASAVNHLPHRDRPQVYLEVDGPHKLYTIGSGSFMADLVRLAGGRPIFDDVESPYFVVDADEIVRRDPDVILIDHPFQYKTGVAKREGWKEIAAVRDSQLYDVQDFDMVVINRPGPRIAEALQVLSRLIVPEAWHGD